jgi:hypothetical protein
MHEIRDSDWDGNVRSPAAAWDVDRQRHVYGMHVVSHKRSYVLPWTQFLYADGTATEVRAIFSLHTVIVKGVALEGLLSDLARHVVTELRQPMRVEAFEGAAQAMGPRVVSVQVVKIEEKP